MHYANLSLAIVIKIINVYFIEPSYAHWEHHLYYILW